MTAAVFREARRGDEAAIARFVRGLAESEGRLGMVTATPATYTDMLFGATPLVRGVIIELDREPAGCALYYLRPGTYTGTPGLFVEDVFVDVPHRGRGLGRQAFRYLARQARDLGCDRMEWYVRADNTPARGFYRALGARHNEDVLLHGFSGKALLAMAA